MTVPNVVPPHIASILSDSIEIALPTPEHFLKVKETLTRIGVASQRQHTLSQSCHIFHKQGHYYILHFKELFLLDGKVSRTSFTEEDRARRNTIANLLSEWGLVRLVDPAKSAVDPEAKVNVTVLPFKDKSNWQLVSKYEVGKKK